MAKIWVDLKKFGILLDLLSRSKKYDFIFHNIYSFMILKFHLNEIELKNTNFRYLKI